MTRRSVLGLAALPALAAGSPVSARVQKLQLKHIWTTVMSSSTHRDVLYTTIQQGGLTARGEGAGIVRYGETAAAGVAFVNRLAPELSSMDLRQFGKVIDWVLKQSEADWAAKAALDIAIHDWVAQRRGIPVHALWGLDPQDAPLTTFSIGIDKAEVIRQKVREAEAYPVLKIKVGLTNDEEVIEAVRSVTKKPLRVDANEGWKDKDEAVRKINWLETMGVEFIEQPMPAHMIEETRYVRQRVHIPIIADEACLRPADIPKLANAFDGVNIKIDKAGGLLQGYRMIQIARSLGLKTMLGCMISSSVAITAAAQLSPLVDYADLDGNLLIANDPFAGVRVVNGKLTLPAGPGLGLKGSLPRG
jgi:L-alanine-DL-glutamate epimerase-like enolase superfamily enzyme